MNLKMSGLIVLSFLTGAIIYPSLPPRMASHWDIAGRVNAYLPRFWGAFTMPLLALFLYALFLVLPRLDPLKANVAKFRADFDRFIFVLILFLYYLYLLTLFWNLGYGFNLMQLLSPAFSVLFYFTGLLLEKARPNWFIGIRTPWTMTSPRVWKKTHALGGRLFKICSALALLGVVFPRQEFWWVIVPLITSVIYLVVFSWREYSRPR
jgi:uncharacterized membrane protein